MRKDFVLAYHTTNPHHTQLIASEAQPLGLYLGPPSARPVLRLARRDRCGRHVSRLHRPYDEGHQQHPNRAPTAQRQGSVRQRLYHLNHGRQHYAVVQQQHPPRPHHQLLPLDSGPGGGRNNDQLRGYGAGCDCGICRAVDIASVGRKQTAPRHQEQRHRRRCG